MVSNQPDDDHDRAHGESPAEGDPTSEQAQPRQHAEEPAEGADDDDS